MRNFTFLAFFIGFVASSCVENTPEALNSSLDPRHDLFMAKQFPFTDDGINARVNAMEEAVRSESNSRSEGSWKLEGPGNIGARANCLAVSPHNSNIIIAGFSAGGLWRSMNGGTTWESIFDKQAYLSIGCIDFHPTNPNKIVVGTGDPNVSGYPSIGDGIYVSEDLGSTWAQMGLEATRIISNIKVSRQHPNTIYASAMGTPMIKTNDRGLYKSENGGNSWQQILFVNDSTGVSDFVVHPQNDEIIYAITWNRIRNNKQSLVGGPDAKVYRSTNGGDSWEVLQNGLPDGSYSRLAIDISISNPNVLYVSYTGFPGYNLEGVFHTEDGGDSWSEIDATEEAGMDENILGGFGWYFGKIKINPKNENDVFVLGVDMYRYNATTQLWTRAVPQWFTYEVHADKHDLVFNEEQMYLATDGGVYRAEMAEELSWIDIENIPTTQFYRTAFNSHQPDIYYGGAQDNGTTSGNSFTLNEWERIYGGDGFQMRFHPTSPDVMYAETQNGNIVVSTDGGLSFDGATDGLEGSRHWDMQYILSPHNPDILYAGTDAIYKSIAGPIPTWYPISNLLVDENIRAYIHQITCLDQSPLDSNFIYCGTSDGLVWKTKDGGNSGFWDLISANLPQRYVSSIKASPSFDNTLYVTYTGYKDYDFTPKIYKSIDGGDNWQSIAGNLPNLAINDVFIYPSDHDNILFVATDGGVYVTLNAGLSWDRLGDNMPYIPVYDMDLNLSRNELVAATFARGIQTFNLNQIGVNLETKADDIAGIQTFRVFPTIAYDEVKVIGQSGTVKLFNSNGNLLNSWINQKEMEVSLRDYLPGIYFITDNRNTVKVLKM